MSPLVEQPVVLAIGAQPDSAESLCAGTLALLRERGWRVTLASLTPGDCGDEALSRTEAADLRRNQATRAAALLDADYFCLESADFTVTYGDELCRRATALIRTVRPAVVLTHGPDDAAPDHEETSRIVRQACLAAPVRPYETRAAFRPGASNEAAGGGRPTGARDGAPATGNEPTGRIPHLYYLDPVELIDVLGRPVEPALIVDITAAFDLKTRMLAQYVGQAVWRRGQPSVGQGLDEVLTWAQKRGERVGCRFGEGFRQHVGPAYPRDDLLRQVLGPLAHQVPSAAS